MRGRKSKLTKKMIDKIEKYLSEGLYVKTVCKLVGISEKTFYEWLNKADTIGGKYKKFKEAVERAEAKAERNALAIIQTRALDDWRAASWFLERRYPDRWGSKNMFEIGDGSIKLIIEKVEKDGKNNQG